MKFRIKDEDGNDYTVEEVIEKETTDAEEEMEVETKDSDSLTPEEITALKSLAANAAKILELLTVEEKEHEENPELVDEDEEEDEDEIMDEDEDEDDLVDDEDEEVIETEERKITNDSKKSYGSIERKKKRHLDSMVDHVSEAWTKRYNGGRN